MTSQQQRLEELRQQAKELTEQIEQLEEQINNTQPTSGLLGRWAKHPEYGDVLITKDRPSGDWIDVIHVTANGTTCEMVERFDYLTFPEQTACPEDVPVGEAWLVDVNDGNRSAERVTALKNGSDYWNTGDNIVDGAYWWNDDAVTPIAPLIPARPQDTPETVTTEDEYEALPEGSIVAKPGEDPWTKKPYVWEQVGYTADDVVLSGTTRHILRKGWGK